MNGRSFVTPVDVERLFLPVVMHRIVFTPSFVATAREIGWDGAAEAFRAQCADARAAAGRRAGRRRRRLRARRSRSFPRRRVLGLAFGGLHSQRRGQGSDVAGSRPYQPGDDVKRIDWNASARLSLARGSDEFIVREHYAEEAPRVVVLCDRRPTMGVVRRRVAVAEQAGGDPRRSAPDLRQRGRRKRTARLPRPRRGRRHVLAAAAQRARARTPRPRPAVRRAGEHGRARAARTDGAPPRPSGRHLSLRRLRLPRATDARRVDRGARAPVGDRPRRRPRPGLGAELSGRRRCRRARSPTPRRAGGSQWA